MEEWKKSLHALYAIVDASIAEDVEKNVTDKIKYLQQRLDKYKKWHRGHPDSHDAYCNAREGKDCNCELDELLKEIDKK